MKHTATTKTDRGFSTLELTVVMAMSILMAAIAVPSYIKVSSYLRSMGDLRSLNAVTAQAKMRAAADFTHARIYANLANNTFHLEVWNKANNCWQTDGDRLNNCTAANSPVTALSQNVTFGTAGLGVGPTAGTAAVNQSPACITGVAGPAPGGTTANTACIEFNSRGIPVNTANVPIANGAIYIADPNSVETVTVSATGSIQSWISSRSCQGAACWHAQ
jgi:Tfp pilus assembly protein FimT